MQEAKYLTFMQAWDERKRSGRLYRSNIFMDAASMAKTMQSRKCLLYTSSCNLYLFVPRRDFFDMLYVLGAPDGLAADMESVIGHWNRRAPIRASIIGTEPATGALARKFMDAGFTLGKKLLRMRVGGGSRTSDGKATLREISPEQEKKNDRIAQIKKMFANENRGRMFVATPADAREIVEILLDTFDVLDDNIPEWDEILENIKNGYVFILREDDKIASIAYIEVRSHIGYHRYHATRPEYRGGSGFNHALVCFAEEQLSQTGIHISRWIHWRDAAEKKVVKFAIAQDELPEGVVLYNMKLTSGQI